mgnify:FL=1
MILSSLVNRFNQSKDQTLKSINSFLMSDSLSVTPAFVRQTFPNLLIERLYYAEGRQHPFHPLHGSHADLCRT